MPLRPIQASILEAIEAAWDNTDVFLVSAPTGVGKSLTANSIAYWARDEKSLGSSIVTPTNQLVDQYRNTFCTENPSHFTTLRAKTEYICNTTGRSLAGRKTLCAPRMMCPGCTKRKLDVSRARTNQILLNNYHIVMLNRLHRPVLIADEAHNLIPVLQQMGSFKLWADGKNGYNIPLTLGSREEVADWAASHMPPRPDKLWKKLQAELKRDKPHYFIEFVNEYSAIGYPGRPPGNYPCLKMTPLSLEGEPSLMWNKSVKKIVLMSATINMRDARQLGLGNKRITHIEGMNPIEAKRRAIIVDKDEMLNMSRFSQDENMKPLADYLMRRAEDHLSEKGLIHMTYSMAEKLRKEKLPPRFLFHTKDDKQEVYQRFRNSDGPHILVASGMYEGVDLPYDLARWQVVGKIPWMNLGNEVTKYMAETDEEWYSWQAARTLIQACGRTTRAEDDFSTTYILDATFSKLWEERNRHLFPSWFVDAVVFKYFQIGAK